MPIHGVNSNINYQQQKVSVTVQSKNKNKKSTIKKESQSIEISGKFNIKDFEKLREQSKNDIEAFKKFIQHLISYQSSHHRRVNINIKVKVKEVSVTEEAAESKEDTAPDLGYWSAEKTADRILDFAKEISGGNPEKFGLLRESFKKGFEEAEKVFGGTLPDVSYDTYDLVMEGFDKMEEEFSS